MSDLTPELVWHRCPQGYRLLSVDDYRREMGFPVYLRIPPDDDFMVVAKTDKRELYRPLENYPTLWRSFANVRSPADFLKFTCHYGPLGRYPDGSEPAHDALQQASRLRSLIALADRNPKKIASIYESSLREAGRSNDIGEVDIIPDPIKGVRVRIRIGSLIVGMEYQFALELLKTRSGDIRLRECEYCGDWFATGQGTGRRLDSTFCSDQHRIDFNSRKRSRK
jgi:hypothetical protein